MENLRIILLSGPFKVGKSTLTGELVENYGFCKVSSSSHLRTLVPNLDQMDDAQARLRLQEKGDQLDRDTDYLWVIDPVTTSAIARANDISAWLIDAVRKQRQVEHFRTRFGSAVTHVHLLAPDAVLKARSGLTDEAYKRAISHPNEINARSLGVIADKVFDTSQYTSQQIAAKIAEGAR